MYNEKYKIKFNFNPIMQCILGKNLGWILVLDVYNNSRPITKEDEVKFIYNKSSFSRCVKHINKINNL